MKGKKSPTIMGRFLLPSFLFSIRIGVWFTWVRWMTTRMHRKQRKTTWSKPSTRRSPGSSRNRLKRGPRVAVFATVGRGVEDERRGARDEGRETRVRANFVKPFTHCGRF